jgi:hypothetical protein
MDANVVLGAGEGGEEFVAGFVFALVEWMFRQEIWRNGDLPSRVHVEILLLCLLWIMRSVESDIHEEGAGFLWYSMRQMLHRGSAYNSLEWWIVSSVRRLSHSPLFNQYPKKALFIGCQVLPGAGRLYMSGVDGN